MEKKTVTSSSRLKSKFIGCILGVAIGDALGRPFEGSPSVNPEKVKMIDEVGRFIYTDDTHMTIGVAESLIRSKGFNGKHMAETFIKNYEDQPDRGYGPGPPAVFKMIKKGKPWKDSDKKLYPGGSFGNGSAMRVAPVGLLYHDKPERLREIAYESSRITHSHQLSREGAAIQAYAIALAVNGEPANLLQSTQYIQKLKAFTQKSIYCEKLAIVEKLLNKRLEASDVALKLGNGIEAFNSVPTAIYSFASRPDSFKKTVTYAISLGGDTDTIGAMAGAIAGAYHGYNSIPKRWLEKLENKEYLEELALKLLKVETTV